MATKTLTRAQRRAARAAAKTETTERSPVYREGTKVIAPGEKRGTTEQGVVERKLRGGKIRVVFSDESYGDFDPAKLKPVRRAEKDERKTARKESQRSERRAKLTPEEQAKAIEVFNQLTGHVKPVKPAPASPSVAYADALVKVYSDILGTYPPVLLLIAKVLRGIASGKLVFVDNLGMLRWVDSADHAKTLEALKEKGKPPRYVLSKMTPDAIVMHVVTAHANSKR